MSDYDIALVFTDAAKSLFRHSGSFTLSLSAHAPMLVGDELVFPQGDSVNGVTLVILKRRWDLGQGDIKPRLTIFLGAPHVP